MRLYTTADLAAVPNLMERSFAANLMRIQPNGAFPLFGLSGMSQQRMIRAIAHSYWSKTAVFPAAVATAEVAAGDTTVPVADSSQIREGSILMNYLTTPGSYVPHELVYVTSITSATEVEVIREYAGSTTGQVIANGMNLVEVGNAYEEGSSMPTAKAVAPREHTNFTQIFRNSWDVTYTADAVALEPGYQLMAENKEDAAFFHAEDIEWSTIFGRKSATTRNGRPLRTMDGIESIITEFAPSNINAAGSTTTFKQLEALLHPTMDTQVRGRTSGRKTIFCGSQALDVINEIGRASGYYELTEDRTEFGMTFRTFKTSRGTWELVEHQLMNSNDHTKKMALIADINSFDYLKLRDTMHMQVAHDGTDATAGHYTTELSVEMPNPLSWGIIYDLTAAA